MDLVVRIYDYPTIEREFRVMVEFRNEGNFFERFNHLNEKPKFVEIDINEADKLGVDYDVRKSMNMDFRFKDNQARFAQLSLF
jgi:hypothetical protein